MKTFTLLILILSFIIFSGFRSESKANHKSFEKFLKKSSYVLISSGKTFVDGKEQTVQSFYISKGEVTNFQYLEFLSYLKANNETEKLKICQVDSMNWNTKTSLNNKYADFYHGHPAYKDYPVVNISHEAAKLYCDFIAKTLTERFGVGVSARLPLYAEYVRAARGDDPNMQYGWNSNSTRNKDGKIQGNFTRIGEECVTKNPETGKYEVNLQGITPIADGSFDILAPSESYWPNQFGVFNLSGNVAEMISEKGVAVGGAWNNPGFDVRIDSKKEYSGSDNSVGFRVVFTYVSAK
jgi:formylglycine-generating enzyme required for sulfatase activity